MASRGGGERVLQASFAQQLLKGRPESLLNRLAQTLGARSGAVLSTARVGDGGSLPAHHTQGLRAHLALRRACPCAGPGAVVAEQQRPSGSLDSWTARPDLQDAITPS